MSSRPPLPPSHEPFDADEAAIARAYRALPGGEPSPDLDARILSQARAAVTRPKRQPRPWFLGAGFGAAAAAVMAAGVAWQLGWLGGIPGAVTTPGASQRNDTSAPRRVESAPAATEETVDIDYVKEERKAKDDAPAAAKPSDRRRQNAKLAPPPAAPAAPPAPPAPAPVRDEPQAPSEPLPVLSAPAPQPFPESAPAAAADATLGAARAATEREGMAEQDAAGGAALGRVAKQIAALPPWNEDERLPPAAWLERVRERVNRGERQGAEYSLRRFVQVHPQLDVPRELQRLLVE